MMFEKCREIAEADWGLHLAWPLVNKSVSSHSEAFGLVCAYACDLQGTGDVSGQIAALGLPPGSFHWIKELD